MKVWGHALARLKRDEEAIEKFEDATALAPRWGRLHIDLGKALWREGRFQDARQKFRAAGQMDLSDQDRKLLQRVWKVASTQR